jgi:hypothetical protein
MSVRLSCCTFDLLALTSALDDDPIGLVVVNACVLQQAAVIFLQAIVVGAGFGHRRTPCAA